MKQKLQRFPYSESTLQTPNNYPAAGDIVIFQPQFVEFGGEERVILSLARELHAQGKAHSVVCYEDSINLASFADWPLTVHQLKPGQNPLRRVLALRSLLAYLHKMSSPIPVLFNIQSAYHAGVATHAPYHSRIPDTYRLLGFSPDGAPVPAGSIARTLRNTATSFVCHWATRRGIRQATRFVTNTALLKSEMQQLYGRAAEVIYLGGFGGPHIGLTKQISGTVELLTVSRLQLSKRLDWILHALAQVQRDSATPHTTPTTTPPAWRLHIAGSGPDEMALRGLAASLGLGDRVIFHGFVTDAKLKGLYDSCHVFLMPAKQGYGLPAIEALYQKLAVVVSDESGVVEILRDTPWVSVATGGKAGFASSVQDMLQRVKQPEFFSHALPALPTESLWAKNIIRYFDW